MEKNNVAITSVKQIPGLFKKIPWVAGMRNLDVGGGKYDLGTEYLLREHGVVNFILDRYNRSFGHNVDVLWMLHYDKADSVTFSNVLNVIEDKDTRLKLMTVAAYQLSKPDALCYISVYQGDKTGVGKITSTGSFQANRRLKDYLDEVRLVYPKAIIKNGHIIAEK